MRRSNLVEIVREACFGLYHHRFRAALSMLGISWGIISVVVLLSGGIPPVGETIRIAGQPFEVVGVMEEKVQLSNYNQPDKYCVFVPWTTMGGLTENRYVATFVWQAVSPSLEKKALGQVREFLAKRYRFNPADTRAITMRGSEENQEVVGGIVTGLKVVLKFIGVLTLAIG